MLAATATLSGVRGKCGKKVAATASSRAAAASADSIPYKCASYMTITCSKYFATRPTDCRVSMVAQASDQAAGKSCARSQQGAISCRRGYTQMQR